MNIESQRTGSAVTGESIAGATLLTSDQLDEARELLWEVSQTTSDASQGDELPQLAELLLRLVDLLQQSQHDPTATLLDAQPLAEFITQCLTTIRAAASGQHADLAQLQALAHQARHRWGDAMAACVDPPFGDDPVAGWLDAVDRQSPGDPVPHHHAPSDSRMRDPAAGDPAAGDELRVPSDAEISQILLQLTQTPTAPAARAAAAPVRAAEASDEDAEMNDELREAFMDDASRCVSAMEEALLAYEAQPKDRRPLQQICRELHTLKGASGSVGLSDLADYLHGIEDRLRDACDHGGHPPSIELLFQNLDSIRNRIAAVHPPRAGSRDLPSTDGPHVADQPAGSTDAADAAGLPPASSSFVACDEGAADEESLRVKPSQLNRLMDMLAELVMLRNRRDCELAELKAIHGELLNSVSQLRVYSDRCDMLGGTSAAPQDQILADEDRPLPRLSEVAGDVLEAAQRLRASYQPVAEGNEAVSRFIRQFRQELVGLRRMPVAGLFRRLQRVASDAARAEGKQVRLCLLGEDAGIERSLQQRLYEPLLHIIRNAVSHGIEHQEQRARQGKPPVGRITLEARTGPDMLVIEIRDDGRGLDYDALRRRGLELGLLNAHTAAHQEELSQLIFHPGFSTRHSANQVAGRGVGMDVVASTIQRMRGWVEVDSVTGEGTTFRLSFPLPSVIQHTMVFRSAGQIFALPMQFIQAAGDVDAELPTLRFSDWIDTPATTASPSTQSLVIGGERSGAESPQGSGRRFRLLVDSILGPEEVVVRPLPALLKHHPFCSGATLSGTGDVVLVLDNHRFVEWAAAAASDSAATRHSIHAAQQPVAPAVAPRVLVVDDSLSARKRVVRCLRDWPVETVEAADGQEACELLRKGTFAAVFSDLEMPHLDGLGLLAEIQAGRCGPATPLVIISSRTEPSIRERAAALGVAGYLAKPATEAALQAVIREIPSLCSVTGPPHANP